MAANQHHGQQAGTEDVPAWLSWAYAHPGESRYVSVNGCQLHYLCWSLEDSTKPAILLVHGMRGHAHWWDAIAPFLARHYRVVALDLSGMGDSGHRAQYTKQTASGDIVGFLQAIGLSPVTAVAHSFSGPRLLRAVVDAPHLFSRAIILDSYFVLSEVEVPDDPAQGSPRRVYPDYQTARNRYRLMPEQPEVIAGVLNHIAHHSIRKDSDGWTWKFDHRLPTGIQHEELAEELLPLVPCRVDVVFGENSTIVREADAERVVALLPEGHGPFGIPGAFHHMLIDQPTAVVAILRGLMADQGVNRNE
jgi:pimeloyl-ACP methyl ester carboxylesterase